MATRRLRSARKPPLSKYAYARPTAPARLILSSFPIASFGLYSRKIDDLLPFCLIGCQRFRKLVGAHPHWHPAILEEPRDDLWIDECNIYFLVKQRDDFRWCVSGCKHSIGKFDLVPWHGLGNCGNIWQQGPTLCCRDTQWSQLARPH